LYELLSTRSISARSATSRNVIWAARSDCAARPLGGGAKTLAHQSCALPPFRDQRDCESAGGKNCRWGRRAALCARGGQGGTALPILRLAHPG
jgi:hypothetical protein